MPAHDIDALGARAMAHVEAIAGHTDIPGEITRLYLSPAHRQAAETVRALMEQAGMAAAIDAAGSVQGRYEGRDPSAPSILIGSHIDSVVDAGRYDGVLGVVAGIVVVEELARLGLRLSCPVEVVAFGDEENVRFPTNLSTAHALMGTYETRWLEGTDRDGVTLRDALHRFGGDASAIDRLARPRGSIRAYLEAHIEQGPVLEAEGLPLGVVSAIAGVTRARVTIRGEAGHAGTVPMPMRRDALAAAAEMIALVERIGGRRPDTVATVGVCEVKPGAVNVIAGGVDLTVDARSPDDAARRAMVAEIRTVMDAISARRGVTLAWQTTMDSPATPMAPAVADAFGDAIGAMGLPVRRLLSGAGHDGVAIAPMAPVGMLFVRCKGGISHNPAESITAEDAGYCVRAMMDAVIRLAGA